MKKITTLIIVFVVLFLTACSNDALSFNKEVSDFLTTTASCEVTLTTQEIALEDRDNTTTQSYENTSSIETSCSLLAEDTLVIQFIDVGQADAALIECGGEYMLIDGGNRADSKILYAIIKKKNITHLDYVVGTHAHEDHIGGIPGALEACQSVGKVYSPVTQYDSKTFSNFAKAVEEKGVSLTVPCAGDEFNLGSAIIQILGPVKKYDDTNNTSIVLKVVFGETSFLFTGDMEREAEIDLIEAEADVKANVLKVGHHGSESSTSYRFLKEVAPEYGVISVGEDNSYGHPHEDPLSRLRDADVKVFRSDEVGDIFCTSDGKTIIFETKKY